jgi:hypothetical protein
MFQRKREAEMKRRIACSSWKLWRGFESVAKLACTLCLAACMFLGGVQLSHGQVHFRIRSDDTQPLNANAGWGAALDTNATIEAQKKFRIRFEIEDRSSNGNFKLQYRRNAAGWNDALGYPDNDPDNAPSTPEVWVVTSSQYNDGDPTADVLAGSSQPFVRGVAKEKPSTGKIDLRRGHTEVEFAIVIPTFYDGAKQNGTGDTFDFRLVRSDNTVISGAFADPRVTLTVPAGLIGATYVESPNRIGPFKDGNGNLYAVLEPAETDNVFMVIKSADGGRTWKEQDGANRPDTDDLESVDAVLAGDELYIAHHGGKSVVLHVFRVSTHPDKPDTYRLTDEPIAGPITYEEQSVALEVLSGGKIRCFYARTIGNRGRIFYKTRDGKWGAEQSLDTQADADFYGVAAVRGASDKVHIVYYADNGNVYHRSLTSADILSERKSLTADAGTARSNRVPFMPPVFWDEAGDEKIMVGYRKATDQRIYTRIITNDAAPGIESRASDNPVSNDQAQSRQPTANLANDGSTVYLHYADAATEDIFRDVYTPNAGWGLDVEERDGVEADLIRGLVFTHSKGNPAARVIGYLVDNGSDGYTGTVRYYEYQLSPPRGAMPSVPRRND